MKIKDVITALERFAPLPLQEDYDNAGLQIGLTETEVSGALLCLDVTEAIVDEAIRKGCNLIVSHHPLIFRKLAQVSDANYVQRVVMSAIKNDIAIVSMHTNLDAAKGGVNFMIARKLGLCDIELVTEKEINGVEGGSCTIGRFSEPMSARRFVEMVKETFNCGTVMTNELLERPISKVAICGGAGSFVLPKAMKLGADAFITGEMHYHEYFDYEQKIQIAVLGHYESEQYTIELLKEVIEGACPEVRCEMTEVNTNPIRYW